MKKVNEMTDRELLEFIFGTQTVLMRKINRIEKHLRSQVGVEVYHSPNEHWDEVYEKLQKDAEGVIRQINILAKGEE